MCSSSCTLFIFLAFLVGATILNIAAIALPKWAKVNVLNSENGLTKGLFGQTENDNVKNYKELKDAFKTAKDWEKAVMALVILGLMFQVAGIVWSIVVCMACCCRQWLSHFLLLFSVMAFLLLLVGVIVYGVKTDGKFMDDLKAASNTKWNEMVLKEAFWMECGAVVLMAVCVGLAGWHLNIAKNGLGDD